MDYFGRVSQLSFLILVFICILHSAVKGEHQEPSTRGRRQTTEFQSSSYFLFQSPKYPRDCQEVQEQCEEVQFSDGVYLIKPDGFPEPFEVFCNNSVDNGGWTVFQRRIDGSLNFYRKWASYKSGFGFLNYEFWLGNDKLAYLTNQKEYEFRIDFLDKSGRPFFAKYNSFRITDEESKYRIFLGAYDSNSTVGTDALRIHENQAFSTRDRDNDRNSGQHCADNFKSAWWYNACSSCDLNRPFTGDHVVYWGNFPGGNDNIQFTEMKIRPMYN